MKKAAIEAIHYYLPETTLTNAELAPDCGDWGADAILEKTGVAARRIAAADECASDLAVCAAKRLLDAIERPTQDIDFLLVCTQTPDYIMPATSCLVQHRLGLPTRCGAVDLSLGCSAFVYALALAKGLIETAAASNVLLVTTDTYSKIINRRDRSARTILGDGAAATLISGAESDHDLIGPFAFGMDGRGAEHIIVPGGGARRPHSPESAVERRDASGNWRSELNFYMNGPEVFNFAATTVPKLVADLLNRCGKEIDDIDCFVFHQASKYILEHLQRKLKIPRERFWIDVENHGNTVSSTIPIALHNALKHGAISPGDTVALVAFGVGYSWSATIVEIPSTPMRSATR